MNKKINFLAFIATVMFLSLNGFSQNCDKYLNDQTKAVNTKGIVLKVLGTTVDGILGTKFSSLIQPDQMRMLDGIQYNLCMQWQTAKNDFIRENLEEKTRSTMDEMVKLLVQSGSIPPEALQLLVNNGNITPSLAGGTAVTPTPSQTTEQPRNADDVIVPILPIPPKNENITITFPCQNFTLSENNVTIQS